MKKPKFLLEYVDIKSIKADPKNPRTITDTEIEKLINSIEEDPEFLEARPILINKDRVIFAGHQRYQAAKNMNWEEVPVILMDIAKAKQRRLMLIDNRSNGQWNWEMLANEWDMPELIAAGFTDYDLKLHIPQAQEVPNFSPDSEDNQGKLDEKKKIECPECGHEFTI